MPWANESCSLVWVRLFLTVKWNTCCNTAYSSWPMCFWEKHTAEFWYWKKHTIELRFCKKHTTEFTGKMLEAAAVTLHMCLCRRVKSYACIIFSVWSWLCSCVWKCRNQSEQSSVQIMTEKGSHPGWFLTQHQVEFIHFCACFSYVSYSVCLEWER
jgi:hypothetical protein